MRMRCSVHKGHIRGRVHYWNRQPMCSSCYARFTSNVRILRSARGRTEPINHRRGLLARLRRLLAG
jgi:hypothetical protein